MKRAMDVEPPSLRLRIRSLAGVALSVAVLVGCGGEPAETAPELGQTRQAIAGGSLDVSHDHVFLLASHVDGGGGLCTATLIAPNLLLTARHCVSPGSEEDHVRCGDSTLGKPFPASAFIATNDPRPSMSSVLFRASEVRVLDEGRDTCGYDIALVVLNENVPIRVAAPAIPRIDRDVSPGEQYTAVGYGENEDGKLAGSRMQLGGLTIECRPGSCGEGVESTEFRGETGICSGDSGGPALDSDGKVVGVVSRGGPDCSTPVYGTVTAWRDFIVSGATDAALAGGYEPPFWVATLSSEPPSSGAGGASGAGGEGDACQSSAACADGFVCFGTGTGICRRTCEETAECGAGEVCEEVGGASLCVLPTTSADENGCTVTRPGPSSGKTSTGWGLLLLLGASAWASRRSR